MKINIKKLLFSIITLIFINTGHLVYTKNDQDEIDNRNISITDDTAPQIDQNFEPEYDIDLLQIINETFEIVTKQTKEIEFCLQQIELILNAGKIQFDSQKISKAELLFEIKEIRLIIQSLADLYTTQMNKEHGYINGTCFNFIFIEYLLPIIKQDIKDLNAQNFDRFIAEKFETLTKGLQSFDEIDMMIEENAKNIDQLTLATDAIGLTTLNKIYRYLDTKPLPWYGKSTIATVQDIAFWGTGALAVYIAGIYFLTTHDTKIPYLDQAFPFQKMIGNIKDTDAANNSSNTELDETGLTKAEILKNSRYGFMNRLDEQYRASQSPFVVGVSAALAYYYKEPLHHIYKNVKKSVDDSVTYYFKGDNLQKNPKVVPKTYFKDMIGGEHLEKLARELADYLKNPTRYERAGITPSTGYLLVGPSQTGKSFFAKALKTLIDEEFGDDTEQVKFFSITADDLKYFDGFARIFTLARRDAPCILFIDELDMYGTRRDRDAKNTQELLTSINGVETDQDKKIIVIAATNKPEELDFALKQKGRLGTVITFDYPTYECRKAYLEKQLNKNNIMLHAEMIDTIAQETDGHTYNMIDDIIRQSLQLATYEKRPVVESDFEITLDREIRKIKPNTTISAQEKELVAIYQAGQAAARHILQTNHEIVKITIDAVDKPLKSKEGFGIISENKGQQYENLEMLPSQRIKPTRLGFVFTMSKINNHELLSDEDQEKELMALLAGQAALELIKNKTFNQFGKEDRAKILEILENKISQGTPITDEIRLQAITAKDALYKKVKEMLKMHIPFITTISAELLKITTINKKQWTHLTANYPTK